MPTINFRGNFEQELLVALEFLALEGFLTALISFIRITANYEQNCSDFASEVSFKICIINRIR